jgi:hypothetical protein
MDFIDCNSARILKVCPTCTAAARKKLMEAIGAIKKEVEKAPKK